MKKQVVIYSTRTCIYCILAKKFLKEHNIKFKEVYLDDNSVKAKEIAERSGQMGVPVIEIDGKLIVGFDKDKIKELLRIK